MKLTITPKAAALIADAEGFDTPGKWPKGASGITIGVGYDLGYYSEQKFRADWKGILSDDQINRLSHAIGVRGLSAQALARTYTDIKIPRDGALRVFSEITLPDFAERAGKTFPNAENLPADAQGALVSLVFNRGTLLEGSRRKEMANIASALRNWTNGDKGRNEVLACIASQLRKMKRLWQGKGLDGLLTRRENEAKLVESCITS